MAVALLLEDGILLQDMPATLYDTQLIQIIQQFSIINR